MLAALVEVVSERGVANVTVAHIVGRSSVSRRTFYETFADREDCLLAALDDAIQRIRVVVLPAYEEPSTWRERIRAGLIALLEFLEDERATGRLLIVESLGAGARALECRRRALTHVAAAVDRGRMDSKLCEGPPPMAAEGVVGGVLAVVHSRLLEDANASLLELTGSLMSMIVLPYHGPAAARRELKVPVSRTRPREHGTAGDPLRDLDMRLTYRTVRVLLAIGAHPGATNKEVGEASGATDQGQISKLLARLERLGLIHNGGAGSGKGAPKAWMLTAKGAHVERSMSVGVDQTIGKHPPDRGSSTRTLQAKTGELR
jgi:AcrR family transcriptional regulator